MTDILENPENKNIEMNTNSFKNANYSVSNQPISASTAFKQILKVWRKRYFSLFFGCILSLIALGFGLGLMCLAGGRIAMTALGIFAVSSILLKIMGVGRILMRYVERLYTHNAMFKALSDLRLWFFRQLAKGSASGLGFRHRGDVLSRLVSDIETLDGLYLRLLIPFIGSILTFFVFIGVVGYINPGLGLTIAALYSIGAFFLPLVTAFITREKGRSIIQGLAQLRIDIVDFLSGLREIRAFGAENRLQDTIETKEHFLFQKQQDQAFSVALMGVLAFLCGQLAMLCIFAAAFGLFFDKITPFQTVIALFLVLTGFENVIPLTKAGGLAGQILNAAIRIVGINEKCSIVPDGHEEAPLNTDIVFKNVGFRWSDEHQWIYRNLNFSIEQGSRIAILGASGAGKSTLAALILKVVLPVEGVIEFGQKDMTNLTNESIRKRIGWLSQDTHLFDDTIRENLLLGNSRATDEALWQALNEAAVADVVQAMPDGLDTWLGEGGVKVSGGQGRRIALARTLLSQAPVLLLDEPTTGLDADTEKEFFEILNRVAAHRTIILIMHRLTGVEKLDKIWRVANGQLTLEKQ